MESIEEKTDSDITEVKRFEDAFGVVEEATKPVSEFFFAAHRRADDGRVR